MIHYVIEFILWLLLAFLIGAIVGCLLRRLFAPVTATGEAVPPQQAASPSGTAESESMAEKGAPTGAGAVAEARGEEAASSSSASVEAVARDADTAGAAMKAEGDGAATMPLMGAEEAPSSEEAGKAGEEKKTGEPPQALAASGAATAASAMRRKESDEETASEKTETAKEETSGKTEAEEKTSQTLPPFGLSAPIGGKPDNLTEISGIGKKIEKILHDLGIYHFRQIASWTEKEIAEVDAKLKFKGRIQRERWVEQAKILAEGGETEFAKRVKSGEVPTSRNS